MIIIIIVFLPFDADCVREDAKPELAEHHNRTVCYRREGGECNDLTYKLHREKRNKRTHKSTTLNRCALKQ